MKNIRIAFIKPSSVKSSELLLYGSHLIQKLTGKKNLSMIPALSGMVFASLTPPDYEFTFIDEDIEEIDYDTLDANFIALTAMTVQAVRAYELADEFKKRGKTVVMGGIHPTVLPEEALTHCDCVVTGEGEIAWKYLLEDFKKGQLKRIYRSTDYENVTSFPIPNFNIIKHNNYMMYPIQPTRGCPYSCDFCAVKFSSGKEYRCKPVEQIVQEIQLVQSYDKGPFKKRIFFADDNLYVKRDYLKHLFTELGKLKFSWFGEATVNIAKDKEILELMAQSGCKMIFIGLESISQDSLIESNKPKVNLVSEYAQAIETIQSYGIVCSANFMLGFDHDRENIFEDTVKFVKDVKLSNATCSVVTPFPGTDLCFRLEKEGRILSKDWSKYDATTVVMRPKNMSVELLQEGVYWANKEISNISLVGKHLNDFWEVGPWKTNPSMSLLERVITLSMAVKLFDRKDFRDFLVKAAFNKKSVDFTNILTQLFYCLMAGQFPNSRNPLDIIRNEQAISDDLNLSSRSV